jgi:uncharacterized protein (TIGR03084 family)
MTDARPSDVLTEVLDDLREEGELLDALVADLDDEGWRTPTPSPGWDIARQISHLAWTDETAVAAATDEEAFGRVLEAAAKDPGGFNDAEAARGADVPPAELLKRWRSSRARLAEVLAAHPRERKIPWFGPPMSATSMATARFMETWAHGRDVADALGALVTPSNRLRHIVHLGYRTLRFSFQANGLPAPEQEIRLELVAPEGGTWTHGPEDTDQVVRGSAYDFCLLVTQRRHRDDLDVVATGDLADRWLDIAQAFAGPPGQGRDPVRRPPQDVHATEAAREATS